MSAPNTMTPVDALGKACCATPFVTVENGATSALTRMCLADGCMAWRWNIDELSGNPPTEGYCGLAGRP